MSTANRALMQGAVLSVSDAEQLELIAQDIERLQTAAVLHIAAYAAKAHELFRYDRDEGGYAGWMKDRLGYSRSNAYRLLDVHKRFGGKSVPMLGTLSPSALYLLAAPATPQEAVDQVAARIEGGERMSCATVAETIAKAKGIDTSAAVQPSSSRPTSTGSADGVENAPADTVILRDWKTGVEYVDTDQPAGDDHRHHHDHDHADAGEVGQPAPPPIESVPAPIESAPVPTEPTSAPTEPTSAPELAPDPQPAPDLAATAAAAVNRLASPTELQSFLDRLWPPHKRAFELKFGARNSDNTNDEIAMLAGQCSALLTHAEQNTDAIRKMLARIKKLTGSSGKARAKPVKSNAQLDHDAFARGMGMGVAGPADKKFPTINAAQDSADGIWK
jgi:hypothetical protein